MKMQLRVYLGAYLKNPHNVMVIPDCHFEAIISGGGVKSNTANFWHFFGGSSATAGPNSRSLDFTTFTTDKDNSDHCGDLGSIGDSDKNPARNTFEENYSKSGKLPHQRDTKPMILYQGAVFADAVGQTLLEPNEGHLGVLDSPSGMNRVFGMNVFVPTMGSTASH